MRPGSVARVAVVVLALIGAIALLAAIGWPARTYRDFDFIGMWLAGRGLLEGLDFYDPAVWLGLHLREGSEGYALIPGTGFGYAMPAAILAAPFALLPLEIAAPLWFASQVALAASGLLALSRVLFRGSLRRDHVLLLGLIASSQPLWVSLFTGQVGGFILAIVAHATALLVKGRGLAAGVALGFLLLLKPHLFVWAIPILLVASPARRALVAGMLASGGSLVAISFAIHPDWPFAWLASAGRTQAMNVSRANAWGIAPEDARWLGWLLVALVVAAFVVWWRAHPPVPWVWGAALCVSLFGTLYSWSYDHGILAVPAALIIAAIASRGPAVRVPILVALTASWIVLPWILYVHAHRTGEEPAAGLIPVAVLALLFVAYRLRAAAA